MLPKLMEDHMDNLKEYNWYTAGKNYNNNLEPTYYDLVDCNWDFFYGLQWRNAQLNPDYPQPVFNNINRFATFFVAAIMANKPTLKFESPVTLDDEDNTDKMINESWNEFVERIKLVWQSKNALYNGVVTGDYVGHLIMDPDKKPYNGAFSDVEGQIDFELVDPNNFYVGNPNSNDIQSQPYVQIAGRDMVQNLREEQKNIKELQSEVVSDEDTEEQASYFGKIELEDIESDDGKATGKATYIITYTKKMGKDSDKKTVHASKCTQSAYIYEEIDLGIELYPVALGNWELQRNTYHGMSFVQAAIPAQIFINRGFAMAMKNTIDTAFSKFLYDKKSIGGITNNVATQIGVDLKPGQRLTDVATFIAPGNMSAQVIQMIDLANSYMKESVGASDALLGNINPEQASGVSIAVTSKQSGIPLENPKANLYNWLEDIGRIYYDMVSNLYGTRPVLVTDGETTTVEEFDFNQLQNLYKVPTIEVGASGYWSELASIDTLNNLLDRQLIEFIDYLERMPDGYIKDKVGLINKLKERVEGQEETDTLNKEFIASLTPEEQAAFDQMTPEQQQRIMEQGAIEQGVA